MIDFIDDHPVLSATVFLVVVIAALAYLSIKKQEECRAHGGQYIQTGTETQFVSHRIGDHMITIPQQVPVYGCVGGDQ